MTPPRAPSSPSVAAGSPGTPPPSPSAARAPPATRTLSAPAGPPTTPPAGRPVAVVSECSRDGSRNNGQRLQANGCGPTAAGQRARARMAALAVWTVARIPSTSAFPARSSSCSHTARLAPALLLSFHPLSSPALLFSLSPSLPPTFISRTPSPPRCAARI